MHMHVGGYSWQNDLPSYHILKHNNTTEYVLGYAENAHRLRHYRMPRHGSLMEGPYPNDPNGILIAGNYGFTW